MPTIHFTASISPFYLWNIALTPLDTFPFFIPLMLVSRSRRGLLTLRVSLGFTPDLPQTSHFPHMCFSIPHTNTQTHHVPLLCRAASSALLPRCANISPSYCTCSVMQCSTQLELCKEKTDYLLSWLKSLPGCFHLVGQGCIQVINGTVLSSSLFPESHRLWADCYSLNGSLITFFTLWGSFLWMT